MYDKDNPLLISPVLLQESSLDYICENLGIICKEVTTLPDEDSPMSASSSTWGNSSNDVSDDKAHVRLRFKDEQTFFPSEISEKLLTRLSERRKLNDVVMTLFSSESTRLRHVKIKDASKLTMKGLRTLRGHKIQELETVGLGNATVTDLISCLGEWSMHNLRLLNVARSTFMDSNKFCIVVALSKLRSLQALNVSRTEFNKTNLELVVSDLPALHTINISCTNVTDISALRKAKDRLKSLSMSGIKFPFEEIDQVVDVLTDLTGLVLLDVSEDEEYEPCDALAMGSRFTRFQVSSLIKRYDALPNLHHLDISGKEPLCTKDLVQFLLRHKIKFLGLVLNEVCQDPIFTDPSQPHYFGDKVITGFGSESQILEVLRRYPDRPPYVTKALYYLFKMTNNTAEPRIDNTVPRVDIIQLVLSCAREYPSVFPIQMAATACLFNLTKDKLTQNLHPRILREIVEVDLEAMERYPQHQQLQKNVLLTIYSYRILQEVEFDKSRCTRLVLDCLCAWHDHYMIRMSVAICSMLAAKISTSETSELGSNENYMRKLLSIVQERTRDNMVDITLKFTLSALWNLTDDSPRPCQVFLNENGMKLYLDVLISFQSELAVETKVLGLFNNIAEVGHLRHHLMENTFVTTLSVLLQSTNIEVSYFAAGIVAHMVSDRSLCWTDLSISQSQMSDELWRVVSEWRTPSDEMVAYRSFIPFFPLLEIDQEKSVQLWAVWAIHHVTSKNPQRYCHMLREQKVHKVLNRLINSEDCHQLISGVCQQILQTMLDNTIPDKDLRAEISAPNITSSS